MNIFTLSLPLCYYVIPWHCLGTNLLCSDANTIVNISRRLDLSSGPDSGQGSLSASGLKTGLDRGLCG